MVLSLEYRFSGQKALGGASVRTRPAEGAGAGSCPSVASWASSRSWTSNRGQQVISLKVCGQMASPGHQGGLGQRPNLSLWCIQVGGYTELKIVHLELRM